MKVEKLNAYVPKYPSKKRPAIKAGSLAAAAVLAAGTLMGCTAEKPQIMGDFPADTGNIAEITPEASPYQTAVCTEGETLFQGVPVTQDPNSEEPVWMGEVAVDETPDLTPIASEEPLATQGTPTLSPSSEPTLTPSPEPTEEP